MTAILSFLVEAKYESTRLSGGMCPIIKHEKASGFCILLSEDDAGVRRSLQLLLRSKGFQVRSYTSAKSLLLDPGAQCGDCLVVDYRMPDVDGITMLMALRAAGWSKPAILITGHFSEGLEHRAYAAGISDVLEKPLGEHVLLCSIARLLDERPNDRCTC